MGLFSAIKRSFGKHFGDLEGEATGLKNGKMVITIENGKCIAYTGGKKDVELSKDTIRECTLVDSDVTVLDYQLAQGKALNVNIYLITMKDGKTGKMRLGVSVASQVLNLIK